MVRAPASKTGKPCQATSSLCRPTSANVGQRRPTSANVGQRRQSVGGRFVQRAQAVGAGCGDVVDAAGLGLARPDGKSARVGDDLHVGALRRVLARIAPVIALLGALTGPVDFDRGPVQREVRPSFTLGLIGHFVPVRCVLGDDVDRLVQIAITGGDPPEWPRRPVCGSPRRRETTATPASPGRGPCRHVVRPRRRSHVDACATGRWHTAGFVRARRRRQSRRTRGVLLRGAVNADGDPAQQISQISYLNMSPCRA